MTEEISRAEGNDLNIGQALSLISEITPDCRVIHEALTSEFITTETKCEGKSLFETLLLKI